jgi:hypothetical protein
LFFWLVPWLLLFLLVFFFLVVLMLVGLFNFVYIFCGICLVSIGLSCCVCCFSFVVLFVFVVLLILTSLTCAAILSSL